MAVTTRPVGIDQWNDLTEVFGPRGASAGCWCSFWRLHNREAQERTADDNREALHTLAASKRPPGLIAYLDAEPTGWCSLAPRLEYVRPFRTKGLEPSDPDDASVWSLVCVFVKRGARRSGVASALVDGAVRFAAQQGATILEAYPLRDPDKTGNRTALSSGTIGLYRDAGFTMYREPELGRRMIMRHDLAGVTG